jgi:hypothetical protein
MTTLVCLDTRSGDLRRYVRGVINPMNRQPICTGHVKFEEWPNLPPEQRGGVAIAIEQFRTA